MSSPKTLTKLTLAIENLETKIAKSFNAPEVLQIKFYENLKPTLKDLVDTPKRPNCIDCVARATRGGALVSWLQASKVHGPCWQRSESRGEASGRICCKAKVLFLTC